MMRPAEQILVGEREPAAFGRKLRKPAPDRRTEPKTMQPPVSAPARAASHAGLAARARRGMPYLLVAALSVYLYHMADNFEFSGASGRIGPGAWPKLVLCLMIFTACLGLAKALFGRPEDEPSIVAAAQAASAPDETVPAASLNPPELYPGMVWVGIVATAAYVFLLPLLGFFIATLIYSIVLMWVGRQRRPMVLLGAGAGFALFFMFLFMRVVYVALPLGDEPFSRVSLALMSLMGVH